VGYRLIPFFRTKDRVIISDVQREQIPTPQRPMAPPIASPQPVSDQKTSDKIPQSQSAPPPEKSKDESDSLLSFNELIAKYKVHDRQSILSQAKPFQVLAPKVATPISLRHGQISEGASSYKFGWEMAAHGDGLSPESR